MSKRQRSAEAARCRVLILVLQAEGHTSAYILTVACETADRVEECARHYRGDEEACRSLFYKLVGKIAKKEDVKEYKRIMALRDSAGHGDYDEALYEWLGKAAEEHLSEMCWDCLKGPFDRVWHWQLL